MRAASSRDGGIVRFPGLDETAAYRVRPLGGAALYESELSPCCRTALDWWNDDGIVVDGATLAQWGVRLPQIAPEHCLLVELVREEVR